MRGLLADYVQGVKEYIPVGQKKSLWEQFFTGTQHQYQTIAQQAQDVYSYDISEAYANYKKQQLQLQTNQRLGEGFKQEIGGELQSAYQSAYSDIKTQEATALTDISQQYQTAIEKGEEQFSQLGELARLTDIAIQEYATQGETPIEAMSDMYKSTTDEYGVETKTLTDAGRLFYWETLNRADMNFQDWLLSEDSTSTLNLKDRQKIAEALGSENRGLILEAAGGIGSWNESIAEETKSRVYEQNVKKSLEETKFDYPELTSEQKTTIYENRNRNKEVISSYGGHNKIDKYLKKGDISGVRLYGGKSKTFTDDNDIAWKTIKDSEKEFSVNKSEYDSYRKGDIIEKDGKYYLILEKDKYEFLGTKRKIKWVEITRE